MSQPYLNLKLGDVVHHRNFGDGVVIGLSGSGKSAQARIKFQKTHARDFALAWAPLSKIEMKQDVLPESKGAVQFSKTEAILKDVLDLIQKKYSLEDSNFGDFNLPEEISQSDVIAYTRRYGFRHLRELRHAFRELFVTATYAVPRFSVDILDIGCGPGLSQFILQEFGVTGITYSGFDHATNCLWLCREFSNHLESSNVPQIAGQFVESLHEIKTSEIRGFVIMNHVLNQPSVNKATLKLWAEQLRRIYPHGFYLVSIEPKFPEFSRQAELFFKIMHEEGISTLKQAYVYARGEFGANSKAVNWLVCGA